MKPFRAGAPLASWMLRIALVAFIFSKYLSVVRILNFKNFDFYLASLFLLFGVLFFIGGLLSKVSLATFSALMLFIIGSYKTVVALNGGINENAIIFFMIASISFYFLCVGNKS